jgi:hypothetical protein
MSESMLDKKEPSTIEHQNRTIYKNRFNKGLARSASKNKEGDSVPKSSQKESNTVSLKKKY